MRPVLLLLSTTDPPHSAAERALDLCTGMGVPLIAAHIHDARAAERSERRALDAGFLGEGVGEIIHQAIVEDEQLRVDEVLQAVSAAAASRGVACTVKRAEGRFAAAAVALLAEHDAGHIVVASPRESRLRRLVLGSPVEELRRCAGVPVEAVEGA